MYREKYSFRELKLCLLQEKKTFKKRVPRKEDQSIKEEDVNRLIEMAWQDRVPFDIIYQQYGLTENQLKNKMRKLLTQKAYKRWRKRVQCRFTKHINKCLHKPTRFQGPW